MKQIREKNWLLNAPVLTGSAVPERMIQVHDALQKMVTAILDNGDMPVSISGDWVGSPTRLGCLCTTKILLKHSSLATASAAVCRKLFGLVHIPV